LRAIYNILTNIRHGPSVVGLLKQCYCVVNTFLKVCRGNGDSVLCTNTKQIGLGVASDSVLALVTANTLVGVNSKINCWHIKPINAGVHVYLNYIQQTLYALRWAIQDVKGRAELYNSKVCR
jgi:hypothetical protein